MPARVGRRQPRPFLPWALILAGLFAGTAHASVSFGAGPLLGLATLLAVGQMTLLSQARADRREEELVTARAERDGARELVGWEVHDDALQVLLAAQQDLAVVRSGQDDRLGLAEERLSAGIFQLRMLLRERLIEPQSTVEAELRNAVGRLEAAGVRCRIEVEPVAAPHEALVSAEDEHTAIVVSDDGTGLTEAAARRRAREGHVGITLLRRRIAKAGGHLHIRSTPGEGTTVRITLPSA